MKITEIIAELKAIIAKGGPEAEEVKKLLKQAAAELNPDLKEIARAALATREQKLTAAGQSDLSGRGDALDRAFRISATAGGARREGSRLVLSSLPRSKPAA